MWQRRRSGRVELALSERVTPKSGFGDQANLAPIQTVAAAGGRFFLARSLFFCRSNTPRNRAIYIFKTETMLLDGAGL